MNAKEPVLLTVLIETAELRWYVAGISLTGEAAPLVRSESGNLKPYVGAEFDEQVSFLRHRLSGVLQRGCDRLWGRRKKPCHIVFVADGPFAQAPPELTRRVAEHFVDWMTSPPVVFFTSRHAFRDGGPLPLEQVAGRIDEAYRAPLASGLAVLVGALGDSNAWETAPPKPAGEGPQT
ncbi:MAG: hypothetical protein HUU20_25055 [Pirellulales bacterium]|nr:hypothetical protein [Pirellulales bacterium]